MALYSCVGYLPRHFSCGISHSIKCKYGLERPTYEAKLIEFSISHICLNNMNMCLNRNLLSFIASSLWYILEDAAPKRT